MKLPDEPKVFTAYDVNGLLIAPFAVGKAHYDALRSLCEQLKEDAERYRWMRLTRCAADWAQFLPMRYNHSAGLDGTSESVDTAIDAAPKESDDKG